MFDHDNAAGHFWIEPSKEELRGRYKRDPGYDGTSFVMRISRDDRPWVINTVPDFAYYRPVGYFLYLRAGSGQEAILLGKRVYADHPEIAEYRVFCPEGGLIDVWDSLFGRNYEYFGEDANCLCDIPHLAHERYEGPEDRWMSEDLRQTLVNVHKKKQDRAFAVEAEPIHARKTSGEWEAPSRTGSRNDSSSQPRSMGETATGWVGVIGAVLGIAVGLRSYGDTGSSTESVLLGLTTSIIFGAATWVVVLALVAAWRALRGGTTEHSRAGSTPRSADPPARLVVASPASVVAVDLDGSFQVSTSLDLVGSMDEGEGSLTVTCLGGDADIVGFETRPVVKAKPFPIDVVVTGVCPKLTKRTVRLRYDFGELNAIQAVTLRGVTVSHG